MALIIIFIFGINFFDASEKVPIVKATFEFIEVDNEILVIDKSVGQSQTPYLKRPQSELQDYPLIASHAAINGIYYTDWGIMNYDGPGEYEILMGFRDEKYPISNDTIMVITYIYDENGTVIFRDKSEFYWK
ncbi:MAG: hypothetical protein M8353_02580 [ANME-2 cluster archaeon]|nr:hypothetical protein [ANME-2 cluster archaeon]